MFSAKVYAAITALLWFGECVGAVADWSVGGVVANK
jgi:hypothetical protein